MKFSYHWLKEYVLGLPRPEKVAELLGTHAFEVCGLRKEKGDVILDIDILPNRMPDASNHMGLAQEISAIANLKLKTEDFSFQGETLEYSKVSPWKTSKLKKSDLKVAILDKDAVPRYHGVLVKNITIKPSPKWLQDRLGVLGINSINNVVDITNYIMAECGQPLHAFDYQKIQGRTLTVRMSKKGETLKTLDGMDNELPDGVLIIDDAKRTIDLAGIMGCANSAVDENTKTIFLQAANFDPALIHRASRLLNKRTEASIRYAAGIDPNLSRAALKKALALLEKFAGGESVGFIDIYPKPVYPHSILFSSEKANSVLGSDIPEEEMIDILRRLSFDVDSKKRPGHLVVTIPTRRRDLVLEEDLIEEVGRIYGYDAIEPKRPVGELAPVSVDNRLFFQEKIRDMFVAVGFDELRSYSFIGEKEVADFEEEEKKNLIRIQNPYSKEQSYLRPLFAPVLMRAVSEALKFSKEIRYFEVGRAYRWALDGYRDTPDLEEARIAFAIARKSKNRAGAYAFFELKGALDMIFESLGLHDIFYADGKRSAKALSMGTGRFLHPYQFSEIKLGKKNLGIFGVLHPEMCETAGLAGEMVLGELFLDELIREVDKEKEYRPISKYPAVTRDLAILVPWKVKVIEVLDIIENMGGKLLIDADLFDIYEGSEVGAEKKNFAFHLIFQSADRTLKDEEIDTVMTKITKALEKKIRWEVRK